ncbi:MAG: CvpA family protein [Melioribacteraceae bacterium]|nr:CvpA family protein [Melioribacteraceae bacterium]
MSYLDIIIFVVILIGFLLGYKDGLVRKIIGIIGFILALVLAFKFAKVSGAFISPVFNDEIYLSEIVAGILIFLITVIIISILKRIIHPVDKVNRFINQLLGGISGAVQIVFFISGFLLFLNIFNFPNEKDANESYLYSKVYNVLPFTIDFILGKDTDTKNIIKDFLESESDYQNIEIDSTN